MAWQLIYTSAPRSLEAGRSGFGTVARHRAISPLLVSAIERVSQFSRLPGTDAGRVIFSHRIVAVAGGRFHVLSAIRDAGADYTGRTNHIAHHLIVDPREVAQLGPDGPSPADVLLAMRWVTSWTEQPRYFESTDEVALSSIRPQTNGSAWEQIAGSANQAWLLATGDASRGAYIIQPGGANLRAVFAESLRLIPERLWQISFTTSLQPSDEPPDFRWIGIEEHSPLRAQIESSGRPVLNLAAPDTLPLVEMVQRAEVNQHREFSAPASTPPSPEKRTASFGMPPTASDPNIFPEYEEDTETQRAATAGGSRVHANRRLQIRAVAAVAILGAVVFQLFWRPYSKKREERVGMAESFAANGYFSKDTSQTLVDTLVTSAGYSICNVLATASNALIQTLRDGDLAKLNSEDTNKYVIALKNTDGLQLPVELEALRETVKRAQELSKQSSIYTEKKTVDEVTQTLENQLSEISKWAKDRPLQQLVISLNTETQRQAVEVVKKILPPSIAPPVELKSLKKSVSQFTAKLDPKAKIEIDTIVEHLPRRKELNTPPPTPTQDPGKTSPTPKDDNPIVNKAPPAPPQVPLYFVNGKDSLSHFRIEELGPNMTLFLKLGSKEEEFKLTGTSNNGQLPQLRRSDRPVDDPYFELNVETKIIGLAKGAASLTQSFRIAAKDVGGADVFQIWVTAASGNPLFPPTTLGLSRKVDLLEFDLSALGFSGTPQNPLFVKLPQSCFATKPSPEPQPLVNGTISLTREREIIEKSREEWKAQLRELEKVPIESVKDNRSNFDALAEKLDTIAKFNTSAKNKIEDKAKSLPTRLGGYLRAVSLTSDTIGPVKDLFNLGEPLINLTPEKEPVALRNIGEALNKASTATAPPRPSKNKNKGITDPNSELNQSIELLKEMFELVKTEMPTIKQKLEKEKIERADGITRLTKRIDDTKILPLLSERVPKGIYHVLAKIKNVDMQLVEINVSESEKK